MGALREVLPIHNPRSVEGPQPQAGSTLSDAEIHEATLERLGKWPSFEAQSWACKVVHAILARSTEPAPKKDFLNGWREAIEQLPVSREATPAEPARTEYAVIINGTTYFVAYEVFELIEILREQMGKLRPVRICLETDIECTKGCTDICKGASNA